MTDTDTPMLRIYVYGRHTSKAGSVTNQPQGDDTYELAGTAEDLRRYAETGLQAEAGKFTPDSAHATKIYRNILETLDGADLSYYAAPALEPMCIIEAMHPEHGANWDSDRVGNETFTKAEAQAHITALEEDPEWEGWWFRILQDDGTGAYLPEPREALADALYEWAEQMKTMDPKEAAVLVRESVIPALRTALPTYATRYHGAPYSEAGEAGPDTDNPRQLAEATLHSPGQWLEAISPDGTRTQFKYSGQSGTRIEEIELPD